MPIAGAFVGGVNLVFVLDGVDRGLDVHFSFVVCGKKVPPQASLASRKERTCSKCESAAPSMKNPFFPGLFELHGPNVTHYKGPVVI